MGEYENLSISEANKKRITTLKGRLMTATGRSTTFDDVVTEILNAWDMSHPNMQSITETPENHSSI